MKIKKLLNQKIFLLLLIYSFPTYGSNYCILPFTAESEEEIKKISKLCIAHAEAKGSEFLKVSKDEVIEMAKFYQRSKKEKGIDEIMGVHNFYRDSKLIGLVSVRMDYRIGDYTNVYAECQGLLHPKYRGQGLVKLFRKKFNEEIVYPRIGKPVKIIMARVDGQIDEQPHTINLRGVKSYIHIDNIVARKLMASLGYIPVDLSYDQYMGPSEKVAQILYIYPANNSNSFLTEELEMIIRSNNTKKDQIVEVARRRHADQKYETELTLETQNVYSHNQSFDEIFKFIQDFSKARERYFPEEFFIKFMQFYINYNKNNKTKCDELSKSFYQIIQNNLPYFPLFAARRGFLSDQGHYHLAVRYRKGIVDMLPLKVQYENAIELFLPLANKGNAKAQHNLGMLYYYRKDYTKAASWWEKASLLGLQESKNNLRNLKKENRI